MSIYNDRLNTILNSLEQEIELLRNTIRIHNLQSEIRRLTDLHQYNRRFYNPYDGYTNLRPENSTNRFRDVLNRWENIRRSHDSTSNYGNFNQTNTYGLNSTQRQNTTQTNSRNTNQTNSQNTNQTNTDNINQNINRNTFSRLFQNIVPDLVEVSFVDANGRNISNPRSVLNNLFNNNVSLESLRTQTTIEVYEGEPEMCTICRAEMNEGHVVRKINSCGHQFHINCIDRWLEEHTRCPTCRCNLLTENDQGDDQNTEGEDI